MDHVLWKEITSGTYRYILATYHIRYWIQLYGSTSLQLQRLSPHADLKISMRYVCQPLLKWLLDADRGHGFSVPHAFCGVAVGPLREELAPCGISILHPIPTVHLLEYGRNSRHSFGERRAFLGRPYSTHASFESRSSSGDEEPARIHGERRNAAASETRTRGVDTPYTKGRDPYQHRTPQVPDWRESYIAASSMIWSKRCWAPVDDGHVLLEPPADERAAWLLLTRSRSPEDARAHWSSLSHEERVRCWPAAMLWILHHEPAALLTALEATWTESLQHVVETADVLDAAVQYYSRTRRQAERAYCMKMLARFTVRMLKRTREPLLRQHTIRLLLKYLHRTWVIRLYRVLRAKEIQMTTTTIVQAVEVLMRLGLQVQARELLIDLLQHSLGVRRREKLFQKLCTNIMNAAGSSGAASRALVILDDLLRHGMKPNVFVYTVSILNAFRADEYDMGWDIYAHMKRSGVAPNVRTMSILITAAKRRRAWHHIEAVAEDVRAYGLEPDAWLVADMLHTTYLYMHQERQESAFPDMLRTYQTYFFTDILRESGLVEQGSGRGDAADPRCSSLQRNEKLRPLPIAVDHMLWTYVRYCQSSASLVQLYDLYRRAIATDPDQAALLAGSSHTATAFMYAFGRSRSTLMYCPTIMADMLSARSGLQRPAVETWNVLILSYVRQKQLQAAELVLERMQSHGYKPDRVTWSTLLSGYAGAQSIDKVQRILKKMYREEEHMSPFVMRGLMKVHDRVRLAGAIRKAELDVRREKREEALTRLRRRKDCRRRRRIEFLLLGHRSRFDPRKERHVPPPPSLSPLSSSSRRSYAAPPLPLRSPCDARHGRFTPRRRFVVFLQRIQGRSVLYRGDLDRWRRHRLIRKCVMRRHRERLARPKVIDRVLPEAAVHNPDSERAVGENAGGGDADGDGRDGGDGGYGRDGRDGRDGRYGRDGRDGGHGGHENDEEGEPKWSWQPPRHKR